MSVVDELIAGLKNSGAKYGDFALELPTGTHSIGDPAKANFKISIKSNQAIRAIIAKGMLGVGEQYMLGEIEITGDIHAAFLVGAHVAVSPDKPSLLVQLTQFAKKILQINRPNQSLKNISHHYDLGNDFYQKWLDKNMVYSCAYFHKPEDSLEQAQLQKLRLIYKKLQLKDGERLLDIGCGWGALLIQAAKQYKIRGLGVTLSLEQLGYAQAWAEKEGVAGEVEFKLLDYRELTAKFDKIVSVGMYEHIGEQFHQTYFDKVASLLTDSGLTLVHTIGKSELDGDGLGDWVTNYIFPGAYLPHYAEVMNAAKRTGMKLLDVENLRPHYELTLKHWAERYEMIWDSVVAERGQEFARMWRFYLNLARSNFAVGRLQHHQFLFSSAGYLNQSLTRAHLVS